MISGFNDLWRRTSTGIGRLSSSGRGNELARSELGRGIFLLLLTLAPRVLISLRLTAVCDDGYFYLTSGDAYYRGDLISGLWYLNVNVYPVLLAGFQSCGLDVLTAAKCWGIAVATVTVLPLYLWLKGMFNRNVALAASCVYAVHPEFIELSSEPIRDATFWCLTATSLYFFWRAAAEQRLWQFCLAGISFAFAIHTRSEGWLLILPASVWLLAQRRIKAARPRLFVGTLLAAAMIPIFLVMFNLTVLAKHERWEWGRQEYLRMAERLVELAPREASRWGLEKTSEQDGSHQFRDDRDSDKSIGELPVRDDKTLLPVRSHYALLAKTALRTLEPIPLLLMLVGVIAVGRASLQVEMLPLTGLFIAVGLAVTFRMCAFGDINGRYFLLMFFAGAGAIGHGVCRLAFLLHQNLHLHTNDRLAKLATWGVAIAVGGIHVGEALASDHPSRINEVRLGQALGDHFGDAQGIAAVPHALRVGYSARGRLPRALIAGSTIDDLGPEIEIVIVETRYTPLSTQERIAASAERNGWNSFDITKFSYSDDFRIYVSPRDDSYQTVSAVSDSDVIR